MNQKQVEKLLRRMALASEVLAIAHANLVETNATIVDVLVAALASRTESDDKPTMQ